MESVTLKYKEVGHKQKYAVLREEKSQFQNLANENVINAEVELKLLTEDNDGFQKFQVSMLDYKQSNSKSLFKWVGNLHSLRNKVILNTGEFGEMSQVTNLKQIQNHWQSLKRQLPSKHKDEAHSVNFIKGINTVLQDNEVFTNTLKYTFPFNNFFPDIFNKEITKKEAVEGYTEIPNFIGAKVIPLLTKTKLKNFDEAKQTYEIEVEGVLDKENFDQEKLTALVKTLKNRLRVPTQIKVNYIERYLFDANHWPLQILNMYLIQVPGSIYREEKTILKAI